MWFSILSYDIRLAKKKNISQNNDKKNNVNLRM